MIGISQIQGALDRTSDVVVKSVMMEVQSEAVALGVTGRDLANFDTNPVVTDAAAFTSHRIGVAANFLHRDSVTVVPAPASVIKVTPASQDFGTVTVSDSADETLLLLILVVVLYQDQLV